MKKTNVFRRVEHRPLVCIAFLAIITLAFAACDWLFDDGNTHTHDFIWVGHNTTQHWHECSCGEKTGFSNHTLLNGKCTVCGYDNTPAHIHDFSGDWHKDETGHWRECPADNVKDQTEAHTPPNGVCTECGYDSSNSTHTHDFSGDWHKDETGHWKVCPDDEVKNKTEDHTFDGGNVCTECGYDSTVLHVHNFSGAWHKDATQHWKECPEDNVKDQTAGHTFNSSDVCTVCGYESTALLTNITAITTYLNAASAGAGADDPVYLRLGMDLGDMPQTNSGWRQLLNAINTGGKYVELDLTACTMTGTEFNPVPSVNTIGKNRITAITLPDVAKSIPAGSVSMPPFNYFTALRSVSTTEVTAVGDYAFYRLTSLTSVSLPAVTSIGEDIFAGCTALESFSLPAITTIPANAFRGLNTLKSVSLPAAESVDNRAFAGCTALTSISLPEATGIGENAFLNCTALESVSLPAATTIGQYAFDGCTALKSLSLPAATTIGNNAFTGCAALESVSLPVATTIGGSAFAGCTALKSLSLPAVTTIPFGAFSGLNALASVTLGTITWEDFNTTQNPAVAGLRWAYFTGYTGSGTYTRTPPDTWWMKEGSGGNTGSVVLEQNLSVLYQDVTHSVPGTFATEPTYPAVPGVMTYVNDDNSMSVCTSANGITYVYEYTAHLQYVKTMQFQNELENLGAFTKDSEGNYYFFYGKEVEEDQKLTQNTALVKYDSSGNKLHVYTEEAGPSADNFLGIKIPFLLGSCRMEISGNMVAVHFARLMFLNPDDGLNHQASYGFVLDKDTLTTKIGGAPYVSHSFDQCILPVDNGFVFGDHGDAYPRAFTFAKFQNGSPLQKIDAPFTFSGAIGDNSTGAQFGGVAKTPGGFIFAGTYDGHNSSSYPRNLFILTFDEELNTITAPVWITDYTNSATDNAANPKIAALDNGRYLLMWENSFGTTSPIHKSTHAVIIDATGAKLTPVKNIPVRLSRADVLRYNKQTGTVHWAIGAYGKMAVYSFKLED